MPDTTDAHDTGSGRRTYSGSVVAVVVLVLLLGAVAGWIAIAAQQSSVQAEVHSWEDPSGATMAVTIEVARDPQTALTCELVAIDGRDVIVGQLDVAVPAGGERRQLIDVDVPLRGDAIAAQLRGCSADG